MLALFGFRRGLKLALVATTGMVCAGALPAATEEGAFMAENKTAMDHMMMGMNVHATGDVDRDFALMMIPHHQGAIDMAMSELRHGHDERLRRLAQQIIVDQRREIETMRLALGEPASPAPNSTATPPDAMPMDKAK
jgi:uncharacterized protein (DUF305 family)